MKRKFKPTPAAFRAGDRVTVSLGRQSVTGFVVEPRGPLGGDGRHLYYVHVPMEPDDPMFLVRTEDEMAAATDDPPPIRSEEAAQYLANGGLASILWANVGGGMNQPQAWLCRDTLGGVTHTFRPERGMVGGRIVPSAALFGDRISAGKREEVVAFVESFGLSRDTARRVVAKVGTAP